MLKTVWRPGVTGVIGLAAVACVAAVGVYALRDSSPEPPTFSSVTCGWRGGRIFVKGVMHVRASGHHDYYVEPLYRLDGGRLEDNYDRFYYDVGRGTDIVWHASLARSSPGKEITYCSARGGALVGNPEDD